MKYAGVVFAAVVLLLSGTYVHADMVVPKPAPPAEKVAVPVVVNPGETRDYKVSVGIKGKVPVPKSDPADMEVLYTMRVRQQFGVREKDGLLSLQITALDPQATSGTETISASSDDFPKLILLLDRSWKVTNLFGISSARFQVPGLNYGNLILLFLIPGADKPHAIGEGWSSKARLPGMPAEVDVATTLKSTGQTDGVRSVNLHQEYIWGQQKLSDDKSARSKAVVDSTLALDTGKLLRAHAESEIVFEDPVNTKPEEKQYKAVSKIDIVMEKPAPPAP